MMKCRFLVAVMFTALCFGQPAGAEENGSGAYAPGSIASRIDSMLPAPGWIVRTNYYRFAGENTIRCLTAGCADRADAKARVDALSLTLGWRPDIDLGPRYSYMVSVVVPYLVVDVGSTVTSNGTGAAFRLAGHNQGIGDIEIIPLNISYHMSQESDLNLKLIGRVPTGEFKANRLANLGKNYWSFEPTVSYLLHDDKEMLDAALYAGINLNSTNHDTDYRSGSQAHLEFTLQKKFMYEGDQLGVGLAGYTYRQLSDDAGSGALYKDRRARLSGIGPVVSYTGMLYGQLSVAELKWIHDYEISNRFGGDVVILKTGVIF